MSSAQFASDPAILRWFKSSYSDSEGANCIEIAAEPGMIHVRDSKDRQGPSLAFGAGAWGEFVGFAAEREVR
jgi:hypothetical protein